MDPEDRIDSQKIHLEWASVWTAKCKEFCRKNTLFWSSVDQEDRINSQKIHLEWASVWTAKVLVSHYVSGFWVTLSAGSQKIDLEWAQSGNQNIVFWFYISFWVTVSAGSQKIHLVWGSVWIDFQQVL